MTDGTELEARAARDLLIDLLELGQTYPLRDLPVGFLTAGQPQGSAASDTDSSVATERLVAFGVAAEIVVLHSQVDVDYELRDDAGAAVAGASVATTTDPTTGSQRTTLTTPPLEEDHTYRVFAVKPRTGRSAYLEGTATAKVGLDVALPVRALPGADMEYTPELNLVVVPHGASLEVEVADSQAGVEYALVRAGAGAGAGSGSGADEVVVSEADVAGRQGPITLRTTPLTDDAEIRVRATRTFDTSAQVGDLTTALHVWVRADPAVALTRTPPDGVVDFLGTAQIELTGQDGVGYQAYVHAVGDAEWVRDEQGAVSLPGLGHPTVWSSPAGFSPVGSPVVAAGGKTALEIPALALDSVACVRAERTHALAPGGTSAVELSSAALFLLRPDPRPDLRLRMPLSSAGGPEAQLQVLGGEPGVRYYLQTTTGTPVATWPAYIHRRDDGGSRNHGIGLLAVGIDLAVGTDPPPGLRGDPATTPPTPPVVDVPALAVGDTLTLRAQRAQTGVALVLPLEAGIDAIPAVEVATPTVVEGAAATVRVTAAGKGQQFQLWTDGKPVGDPRPGAGKNLTLTTEPLSVGDVVALVVTSLATDRLPLEQVLPLGVTVTPNPPPPGDAAASDSTGAAGGSPA